MSDIEQTVTLYNQQGASDKVYIVNLVKEATGYQVVGFNGRRGSALVKREKTKAPVSHASAIRIYEGLVSEKKRDGYTEGDDVNGVVSNANDKKDSGLLPQLLNSIDSKEVMRYINDDTYFAQEKYDGVRLMAFKSTNGVAGSNKRGLLTSLAKTIHDKLNSTTSQSFVLDGEAIGDHYYVFDLLEHEGTRLRNVRAENRYHALVNHLVESDYVHIVEAAFTAKEKLAMYTRIMDEGGEGIVFKLKSSTYTEGRPNSGGAQLKYKFVESASCIVTGVHESKRSISISLYDYNKLVNVGNVTIPPNKTIPNVADVAEIRYLYAFREGSLIQPVYLGVRDDISNQECDVSQLKYKQELKVA